jgi:endonuclease
VNLSRTQLLQALDLAGLILGEQIEMEPGRYLHSRRDVVERKTWTDPVPRPEKHEVVARLVARNVVEGGRPELGLTLKIVDAQHDRANPQHRGGLYPSSETDSTVRGVRLLVARCEVLYTGRLTARLPEAVRLLMFKADGSFLVHDDAGGYRPLNWMTPPTVVEEECDLLVIRKRAGKSEDRLEVRLLEVLSDVTHELDATPLEKDGVERHLQEELAAQPAALGENLHLVRREWPTDIGPVDLMCRDEDGNWVAVEIKRIGTIDAVEQLGRYLERIELDGCCGVLAAQSIKPQARTLAEARGIRCVEVDLAVLRGEREPELTLFSG